jgi:hypothetical protein
LKPFLPWLAKVSDACAPLLAQLMLIGPPLTSHQGSTVFHVDTNAKAVSVRGL